MHRSFGSPSRRWVIALAGGLCAAAIGSNGARATDDAILQAAKKEGTVVIYSAAPAAMLDQLTKAFNVKYPGITAEYYRGNSAQVYQRLTAEIAANRVQGDVIHVSDPATIDDLKRADALAPYKSPEYANYDPKYVDKDFTWFVARGHFLNIGYNPTILTDKEAPKTLKDLADPRFKGKVGIMDVRNAGGAYYWQYTVWKLYGPGHFAEMAKNQPKLYPGHGPINDRIITGELSAGVDLNYLTDESILESKAPVKAVYSEEGSPLIWSPVGIVKKAPHPEAAKVLMDFIASKEGQAIFNYTYSYSMRPDVPPRPGMTPLDKIKIMDLSIEDMIAHQDEIQNVARKAWGYQ